MTELDSFLAWIEEGQKKAEQRKDIGSILTFGLFKGMLKRMIEEYRKVEKEWLRT